MEGLLLVKGPNIMAGYLNRPEDTGKAIENGWLHTGDQADIRDGRIHIKGRIKDIIVTSTGEKIAPGDLQLAIETDPLFAQSLVLGENKAFLVALLVLDPKHWRRPREARQSNRRGKKFARRIRKAFRGFPVYATPRAAWPCQALERGQRPEHADAKPKAAIEERYVEEHRVGMFNRRTVIIPLGRWNTRGEEHRGQRIGPAVQHAPRAAWSTLEPGPRQRTDHAALKVKRKAIEERFADKIAGCTPGAADLRLSIPFPQTSPARSCGRRWRRGRRSRAR
jgi:long-subunit acyl-CoA synthetase (AMP-forming)